MKHLNVAIPEPTKLALEQHSKDSGMVIKKIVDLALVKFLKSKGLDTSQFNTQVNKEPV